jgi:hypothetical protein
MKRLVKQYRTSIKFTVDDIECALSLEKNCPFLACQVDSRYACSWGSQYEITYLTKFKKEALAIKKWWIDAEVIDLCCLMDKKLCTMLLPTRSMALSRL